MRLRRAVAIDLGTVSTLIWVAGRGLVLEEPSAIAYDARTGGVTAVGRPADALAGKGAVDVDVVHPLRDGAVAELDAAAAMLRAFLRRAVRRRGPLRPAALVCVPAGATWVERRSAAATLEMGRGKYSVRLIDAPVAAAAGSGVDLAAGSGAFIVVVGGGTTEIAAVAGARMVRSQSLRLAGNAMDDAIIATVRAELGLILSRKAAGQLKMTLGLTGGSMGWVEAVGLDAGRRTPRTERVPGDLVADALEHPVAALVSAVQEMLSDIPAGIAEDIVQGKIRLAGGGALLPGLASRIEASVGIGAVVVDDPVRCVVRGAGEILERGGALAKAVRAG